jgi:hypothetical protein
VSPDLLAAPLTGASRLTGALMKKSSVSFRTWRTRDAHVDELEAEAGDPLQEALQGALIQ